MTQPKVPPTFTTDIPPDLDHAAMIREEVLDWLETEFPGTHSFRTGELLQMANEQKKRWLISRLRTHDIANDEDIGVPAVADALTVLFLRARGVKFQAAVAAVIGREPVVTGLVLSHVWNQRDRGGAVWFGRHGC